MEVKVAPWWESKINWVTFIGTLVAFAALFGVVIPADLSPLLAAFMVAGQNLLIFVLRTWFTKTITPQVALKLVTVEDNIHGM